MKLKFKLLSEEFALMDPVIQGLYSEKNGVYILNVEGATSNDDIGELHRSKLRESQLRIAAEKKLAEMGSGQQSEEKPSGKTEDAKLLHEAWERKYNSEVESLNSRLKSLTNQLTTKAHLDAANTIATELFGDNAPIMLPHVKARLSSDFVEDKAVVNVLDVDGNKSVSSLADLKNEFLTNDMFKSMLKNKASGSGASNDGKGTTQRSSGSSSRTGKDVQYSDLSPADLVASLDKQFGPIE